MAWNIRASRQSAAPDMEILKFPAGIETAASIVLDASAVAPDANGDRILKSGTLVSKNTNNQYERFTAAGAANEVQSLALTGAPSAGSFKLAVAVGQGDEEETAAIPWNATAATFVASIKAALEALAGITTVTVTGSASPFVITVTSPANQDVSMRVSDDSIVGGDAVLTTTTEGDTAQAIKGVLAHTVRFADGTSKSDQPAAMWFHGVVFRADRIVDFATHGAAARTALPQCRFD